MASRNILWRESSGGGRPCARTRSPPYPSHQQTRIAIVPTRNTPAMRFRRDMPTRLKVGMPVVPVRSLALARSGVAVINIAGYRLEGFVHREQRVGRTTEI